MRVVWRYDRDEALQEFLVAAAKLFSSVQCTSKIFHVC